MKFAETDRLLIHGTAYRVADHDEHSLTVFQHDNPGITETIAFEEMSRLLRTRTAHLQRGFYDRASRSASSNDFEGLNDLPADVQSEVLWRHRWCTLLDERRKRGALVLTRNSIRQAMTDLVPQIIEMETAAQRGARKRRSASKIELHDLPKPSTLLEWYRSYRDGARGIMALVPELYRSGNRARRFSLATEAFVAKSIEDYACPLRPSKAQVVERTMLRLKEENRCRADAGEVALDPMSGRTIRRRLDGLDPYHTYAQRFGPAAANRKFNISENGDKALFPMEVLETDSWKIDLITLFARSGILEGLNPEMRARLEKGRRWITVAIDKATRVVVAFRIVDAPSAASSVAVIADATRDKSHIARAMGCENPWPFHGGLNVVSADMGPENNNETFRAAIHSAGGNVIYGPASQPQLRGMVESLFRTFGQKLMPLLHARTHSNPVEKGDYDAERYASLADDELTRIVTRYIVDIYHQQGHEGLGGETPAHCWKRLSNLYGVTPPPDGHVRRAAFGIPNNRIIVGGNVKVVGIEYTSDAVRNQFLHGHDSNVDVRMDPQDLGWITVRIDGKWHAAEAVPEGFHGRSLDEWIDTCTALRQKHRRDAAIHEDSIRRAFDGIETIQRDALLRMELTPSRMSAEALHRLEGELFLGLNITTEAKQGGSDGSRLIVSRNRQEGPDEDDSFDIGIGKPVRPNTDGSGGSAVPEDDHEADGHSPWTLEDE
ncbi:hypothetical protein SUH3_13215 [Pseudosulfitobacter pseudonitzschiae]|uniref:Integrase catalytic domain-containing protein n=2 Tax=Pseudosulfitobacter pseudonitzschiae TaxID=1402135 RepID=A0A073IVU9_9RHOB|nr:hypothetical protein SUH3_13215 [Pseudosulfitobacter pseudonitzschiae]